MPTRRNRAPDTEHKQARKRLFALLEERRVGLGYTAKDAAALSERSRQAWLDIRDKPHQDISPDTKHKIEHALDLEPGNIDTILAGGDLTERTPQAPRTDSPSPALDAAMTDPDRLFGMAVYLKSLINEPQVFSEHFEEFRKRLGDEDISALRANLLQMLFDDAA